MRKRKNLRRMFGYSYMMGGTALLSGNLPSPMKEPVQVVATRGSEFVVPIVAVTGASEVIKLLPRLKSKKRRRRLK